MPIEPINAPNNCMAVRRCAKIKKPKIIVKIGVKLFIIPAKPEEIPVSAYVNRKAGKKLPQKPTIAKSNKSFFAFSLRKFTIDNGSKALEAINIRRAPTCAAEKMGDWSSENIPFFIRMKELPHMQARSNNKIQLFVVVDTPQK
jgi:hypothetical protein